MTACLFDLDGVLTQTAAVHNAAWKQTFDAFLKTWSGQHGQAFVPFDSGADYLKYAESPEHQAFFAKYCVPILAERVVAQFKKD